MENEQSKYEQLISLIEKKGIKTEEGAKLYLRSESQKHALSTIALGGGSLNITVLIREKVLQHFRNLENGK